MNVNFTESAANQARVIIAGEDPGLQLRVYVPVSYTHLRAHET